MNAAITAERVELDADERALVDLLAEGMSAAAVARRLYVAERVVQRRVRALMLRAGACNAAQLVAIVLRRADEPEPEPLTLSERIAAAWDNSPEAIAQRQAALVADLEQFQAEHGTPYRPGGRPRAKHRNGPTATITVAFQGHRSRFVDMKDE